MKPRMGKQKLVLIEWRDAVGKGSWSGKKKLIPSLDRSFKKPCFTLGFILRRTKHYLLVAQTVAGKACDHTMLIPWGMIRRVTKLKES